MHKLAREVGWVLAGQVLAAIGMLVGIRVITEVAPPEVYGGAVLAIGIVLLAQGLAATPLMQAVLRLYGDYAHRRAESDLRRHVARALRRSTALLGIGVALVAGLLQRDVPSGVSVGVAAAVLLVVEVVRALEVSFLNAARQQRPMAFLMALDAWLRPLFAVGAVLLLGASPLAIIAGYVLGTLVAVYTLRAVVTGRVVPTPSVNTSLNQNIEQRLWTYARPLVMLAAVGWTAGQIDRYMIAGILGTHAAGIYAAIYGLVARPFLMAANTVELAVRQHYYEAVTDGEFAKATRILKRWLGTVAIVATSLLVLFGLIHGDIAALLLADEYRESSVLMVWIALGYFFAAISLVVERACYALHDTRGVLLIHVTGAVTNIAIGLPLIGYFGILGASLAVSISFGVQLVIAFLRAGTAMRRHSAVRVARA